MRAREFLGVEYSKYDDHITITEGESQFSKQIRRNRRDKLEAVKKSDMVRSRIKRVFQLAIKKSKDRSGRPRFTLKHLNNIRRYRDRLAREEVKRLDGIAAMYRKPFSAK